MFGTGVRLGVHVVTVGVLAGIAVLVAVRLADLARAGRRSRSPWSPAERPASSTCRVSQVRLFLLYLSPLPLLAVGLFCFSSSVSGLVTGGDADIVEEVASTRPVVMMVLDEFPTATLLDADGTIDAEQFPAFARLSEQSTWFRNYTTHNAGTVQAVPSLLSGTLPTRGRAPLYTDWPDNLFTLLGGSYEMAVQESVTQLCPPDVCDNTARTVTQRTAIEGEGLGGLVGDTREVLRQLVSLNASPRSRSTPSPRRSSRSTPPTRWTPRPATR